MTTDPAEYQPISCDFYDILELIATERRSVAVHYRGDDGQPKSQQSQILDLFSQNHVEYVSLSSGESVRLDRLIAVDDKRLADYSGKRRESQAGAPDAA